MGVSHVVPLSTISADNTRFRKCPGMSSIHWPTRGKQVLLRKAFTSSVLVKEGRPLSGLYIPTLKVVYAQGIQNMSNLGQLSLVLLQEPALRVAILYAGLLISYAFGSLWTAGISGTMEGALDTMLFYIEGTVTILLGILSMYVSLTLADARFPKNSPAQMTPS
ncbi:hypothetical protein ID866_6993 [Astraeus odoratus]|nr:hypothetical protein ID866_6993 [Astraeus odoratus]